MTEEQLTNRGRERRALIVGAVTLLTTLVAKALPPVFEQRRALMASDLSVITSAARVDGHLRALSAVRDTLAARRIRLAALDSAVLDGTGEAAGVASLAEMMSDASKFAKTELGPVQLVAGLRDSLHHAAFARVAVRASFVGSIHDVMTLLMLLEQGPTVVAVRELSITGLESDVRPATDRVRAEVLVEGLVRSAVESNR